MSNASEFLTWREGLESDDLIHAFESIKTLEKIKFEFVTKEKGYKERVEALIGEWSR